MMNSDLKRSLKHFKRHEELGHLKLNFIHKVFLSLAFFVLLPSVLLNLFFKNNNYNSKKIFIFEYEKEPYTTKKEPYTTIYKLLKQEKVFNFIKLNKLYIPVVPLIFLKDVSMAFKVQPMFMFKNLYFLGALSLKISKYYSMIKHHKVSNLLVFQEYSFYMSYFTRVMEHEGGNLYNIQHGIPGDTYCHFRFTKCFVWGEYFKQTYIKNGAEPSQFVITGSIFHAAIAESCLNVIEDIDILYVMQGDREGIQDVLEVLSKLEPAFSARIKQHPRHRYGVDKKNLEIDDEIAHAIARSKMIISHYSTALLDAKFLGKLTYAYLNPENKQKEYVSYLKQDDVLYGKHELLEKIEYALNNSIAGKPDNKYLDNKYIDQSVNPMEIVKNEINI